MECHIVSQNLLAKEMPMLSSRWRSLLMWCLTQTGRSVFRCFSPNEIREVQLSPCIWFMVGEIECKCPWTTAATYHKITCSPIWEKKNDPTIVVLGLGFFIYVSCVFVEFPVTRWYGSCIKQILILIIKFRYVYGVNKK